MRIVCERASHVALKPVLAALLSGTPLTIDLIESGDRTFRTPEFLARSPFGTLPVLTTPTGTSIWRSNEAARLLFPPPAAAGVAVDALLDLESSSSHPSLAGPYATGRLTTSAVAALTALDAIAARAPPSSPWLVPAVAGPSVADVAVWCCVAPALCPDGAASTSPDAFPALRAWWAAWAEAAEVASKLSQALAAVGASAGLADLLRTWRLTAPADKPYFVTTPIYYVNARPHVGHVYTTVVADALARWQRVKGRRVFFMTGTDEHGQKVATAAADPTNCLGRAFESPQAFCDEIAGDFARTFAHLGVEAEHFMRTTDPTHIARVQAVWTMLRESDHIYLGAHEGWYAVADETFVPDASVGDGVDPKTGQAAKVSLESGAVLEWHREENYMFRLSKFTQPLLEHYRRNPDFIVPRSRAKEIESFVAGGLKDLSVSRLASVVSWGIPVPGDPRHVMYVWLDALCNYYTCAVDIAAGRGVGGCWPADLHVVGKDILRFHAVYWPAFLLGAGLPLPRSILAHGWWTKDGEKISKRLGNVFDPVETAATFGRDPLRYYLLREAAFGDDGDYSDARMAERLNSDLADTLGNLVLRLTSKGLCPSGCVPTPGATTAEDEAVAERAAALAGAVDHWFAAPSVTHALGAVWDVLRHVNQYITAAAPWALAKTNPARGQTVLYTAMEAVRICALCFSPVMPQVAAAILTQLGCDPSATGTALFQWGRLVPGAPFGAGAGGAPLFVKRAADGSAITFDAAAAAAKTATAGDAKKGAGAGGKPAGGGEKEKKKEKGGGGKKAEEGAKE